MPQSTRQTSALSARPQSGCSGCFLWVFAGMFLAAGLGAAYAMAFQPLWGIVRSRDWVKTPCVIVSSELKRNGDSVTLNVVYKYQFDNQQYQSDRYCFMSLSTNTSGRWKRKVVKDHPAGHETNCYVNPDSPSEAVIDRGWVPDMWWMLFPIPFVVAGFLFLLVASGIIKSIGSGSPGKPASWQPSSAGHSTNVDSFADPDAPSRDDVDTGPVTLEPELSPFQMLFGSIFVAAFWNGIVSVFVWHQIAQLRNGGIGALDWFLVLFLTPFVLIGIGLIGFVLYTLLAMFNPRPTLIVNSAAIPLGEELRLTWTLSGRAGSIREFKILLKGVERATYRRGTTTTTDTSTFAELVLVETTEMFDMAEGSAKVTIPADTMHSFDAPNNEIDWTLEVRGEIPLWPDVSVSFPITVLPLPVNE